MLSTMFEFKMIVIQSQYVNKFGLLLVYGPGQRDILSYKLTKNHLKLTLNKTLHFF